MQVLANANRFSAAVSQRPADSGAGQAQAQAKPPVDLTQLALAQDIAKLAASAGTALGQTTGELTGVLVNITA